ncbi:MAG: hypothetical protein SGI92_31445 [Bryobacteraceae bacterium]|mgnify:CR=1 FL=1|nr:hypothetical protein [Bryobacteraceae bacterium]
MPDSVLVSDTSVLVDLDRAGLVEPVFQLPFTLAVPDVLFEKELKGEWGNQLLALGLQVHEVSAAGVRESVVFLRQRPALSVIECVNG